MIFFIIKNGMKKKGVKIVACIVPFIFTTGIFLAMFIGYNKQQFGNMQYNYSYKVNMKKITLTSNIDFSNKAPEMAIYAPEVVSRKEIDEFGKNFLNRLGKKIDNKKTKVFSDRVVYGSLDDNSSISINFNGM